MTTLRLLFIAAVVGSLGCTDPLRPVDIQGFHILASADGTPAGTIIWSTASCDMQVSGYLSLDLPNSFELYLLGRLDCTRASGPIDFVDLVYAGTFDLAGKNLWFRGSSEIVSDLRIDSVSFGGQVAGDTIIINLPSGSTGALGVRQCVFLP
jgi:hypothetical protein